MTRTATPVSTLNLVGPGKGDGNLPSTTSLSLWGVHPIVCTVHGPSSLLSLWSYYLVCTESLLPFDSRTPRVLLPSVGPVSSSYLPCRPSSVVLFRGTSGSRLAAHGGSEYRWTLEPYPGRNVYSRNENPNSKFLTRIFCVFPCVSSSGVLLSPSLPHCDGVRSSEDLGSLRPFRFLPRRGSRSFPCVGTGVAPKSEDRVLRLFYQDNEIRRCQYRYRLPPVSS